LENEERCIIYRHKDKVAILMEMDDFSFLEAIAKRFLDDLLKESPHLRKNEKNQNLYSILDSMFQVIHKWEKQSEKKGENLAQDI
jgi:hypothetical protein